MKPRTFGRTLLLSLTSVEYYFDILNASVWFSLRFFVMSMMILGLLSVSLFNLRTLPEWKGNTYKSLDEFVAYFPDDLQVKWDGNQLTTSTDQPLPLFYPSMINPSELDLPPRLGYVLNKTLPSSEFASQLPTRSLLVLTPTDLYLSDLHSNWSNLSWKEVPGFEQPFEMTKATVATTLTRWHGSLEIIFSLIRILSVIIIPVSLFVSRLWIAFAEGLLIFLVIRLIGMKLPYTKVFQLSLHFVVIAQILLFVATVLYKSVSLPLFNLTYWITFSYVLFQLRRQALKQLLR